LGGTGLWLSVLGFGAFKIGRNQKTRYAQAYELPDEAAVERLLRVALDAGIRYFDTAPAYGVSEERLGRLLPRVPGVVVSTKVGEEFVDGESRHDFTPGAVRASVDRSRRRLGVEALDLVWVHSDGQDLRVQRESGVVATLQELRERGVVRAVGFSGKTVEGAREALGWADAVMVEYHARDITHGGVMAEALARGVGVVVKKGLASGKLDPREAIPFVLGAPGVSSLVVGGLDAEHLRLNAELARAAAESAGK
jgi:aryl-alcohol dehydrogenase-like predicted oxidoreductase